VTPQEETKIKK